MADAANPDHDPDFDDEPSAVDSVPQSETPAEEVKAENDDEAALPKPKKKKKKKNKAADENATGQAEAENGAS